MKRSFRIKNKRFIVVLSLLLVLNFYSFNGLAFHLSSRAEISIITCAPGSGPATVYGHSAIRVKDVRYNYDTVFNYGIYDFDAPNFVYRFASGETDYMLDTVGTNYFIRVYKYYKRSVYEQVLNLTLEEKQKIVDFLIWNAQKENRVYRYNFFFDNCATRIRDVIADNVAGGLTFNEAKHSHKTLRNMVEDYHGKVLWLTFGIDLAVSAGSDREASYWEEMFLPDYLMAHFSDARRTTDNSLIVGKTRTLYKAPVNEYKSNKLISPFVVLFIFVLVVFWISFKQFRNGKMKIKLDYWVYGFIGFMGIVLTWLSLFSEHPAMSPNYNLLWALPTHLFFALALFVKKWRPHLKFYHVFVSVWLVLFISASPFIPQKFHPAFYLLVLMVLSRSVFHALLIFKQCQNVK